MSTGTDKQTDAGVPPEAQSTADFVVVGQGTAVAHRIRQARARGFSEYQPTGLFINAGETLQVNVAGFALNNLFAVIGVPKLNTPTLFPLALGQNSIVAGEGGLLSFINRNTTGSISVSVQSTGRRVPTFTQGETTNANWTQQMYAHAFAPVVQLTSARAIVVVRYASARSYLRDPETLMANFGRFIGFQDGISGVGDPALEDCRPDPNKMLFLEGDDLFMAAADGYTWYTGPWALECLLSLDPVNSWGPWHEAGHLRQLVPMTWGLGSGMTEVTVNLYSLAVQEALDGRASRLDEYDPVIKAYLAEPYRDYNTMVEAFHKVVMPWQLHTTFGPAFYPQLHQLYRLMSDPPEDETDKAQRFIIETSLLTGVDLTPFYDRWGLYATTSTLVRLEHLPTLTQPLWETDATHTFPLPMPQPAYIPVLAYLRSNVMLLGITGSLIQIIVRSQWLQPYRYEISVNGQLIASVDNGVGHNCSVVEESNYFLIRVPSTVVVKDKVEIRVLLGNVRHLLILSGYAHSTLQSRVNALFTDSSQTEITRALSQSTLDTLFADLEQQAVDDSLFAAFHRAQKLLLAASVNFASISDTVILIFFRTDAFYEYDYELVTSIRILAALNHGVPVLSSRVGNVWSWRGLYDSAHQVRVSVTIHEHRYTLLAGTVAENALTEPVRNLFTDDTMTTLRPAIGQGYIDSLRPGISGNFTLSRHNRAASLKHLDAAQTLILRKTIDRVETADRFNVHFADDQFKRLNYHLFLNGLYVSEVSEGHPAYSGLEGRHWRTNINVGNQDTWTIYIMYAGRWFPVMSDAGNRDIPPAFVNRSVVAITQCEVGLDAPCGVGRRGA
jgi:hypothetical protein